MGRRGLPPDFVFKKNVTFPLLFCRARAKLRKAQGRRGLPPAPTPYHPAHPNLQSSNGNSFRFVLNWLGHLRLYRDLIHDIQLCALIIVLSFIQSLSKFIGRKLCISAFVQSILNNTNFFTNKFKIQYQVIFTVKAINVSLKKHT